MITNMKILHVVGARPNFMKVAPVMRALTACGGIDQILVHTGQHYDRNMSEVFFQQLDMPYPDINLGIGGGSHAEQTGRVMLAFEKVINESAPDCVLVYGDINSTVAATLVCAKLNVKVGHVEAGLRSFDRQMPEEINRLLTDQIADVLFTPSRDGDANLLREGIDGKRIHFVGNVMIDTLVHLLPKARIPDIKGIAENYALVTLHRPSNVDNEASLQRILLTLKEISESIQIVFPVHPRTRGRIESLQFNVNGNHRFLLLEPQGYLEFLGLQKNATVVVSDSGGIQEETTYLRIPCLTLRKNTERPVTVNVGSNILVGDDMDFLKSEMNKILDGQETKAEIPDLWDGKAGERIAKILTH